MRFTIARPFSAGALPCAVLTAWAAAACFQPVRMARDDSPTMLGRQVLKAPDPAVPGTLTVRSLYYGSGTDLRRRAFRDSVTIKTASVDGSKLATAPTPALGRERREYWGFAFDKLPRNGRVWYPDGGGPFPLVLVVHGNHNMKDFSDPGYEYLGQLPCQPRVHPGVGGRELPQRRHPRRERRARLDAAAAPRRGRRFNDSAGGPFRGKVDMDHIALMGHSRGGEAVAVAGGVQPAVATIPTTRTSPSTSTSGSRRWSRSRRSTASTSRPTVPRRSRT